MSERDATFEAEVNELYQRLDEEAEAGGYHLNPERELTTDLVRGLLINEKRYGYQACPCRLAAAKREQDLDIICPCDYRDPDLADWSACYCGLYVTQEVVEGKKKISSIPERRTMKDEKEKGASPATEAKPPTEGSISIALKYPVWRCKVCGYLCARLQPPEVCPICKVTKDRFERLI